MSTSQAIINTFIGRLPDAPIQRRHGNTTVTKFVLIRNEYAGKERATRKVTLQFTAFDSQAEAIARNFATGDQMIVYYRIENNNYEGEGGTHYGYNFIVDSFEFGAPGETTRNRLAQRAQDA
ncbi:single-stranded DNA-binding protein [Cupriavidus basilensis]|uniref:single-stranded DNA-binding protein n=1 Tax=Cupriavidus basilensis TaxID=68895 RepID=UPI0023E8BE11|nr:single-stranded DNA-binding protein [Cupriavidus basilensis]MDF3889005.1 single-stranded DNA-binding protein [Cupriavidus basilensis]